MQRLAVTVILIVFCFCSGTLLAQDTGITTGELTLPEFKWGAQPVELVVTNNADYMKFVVAIIRVDFKQAEPPYGRSDRFHEFLMPGQSKTMKPTVYIPGSYGPATIVMDFYDVIDTLDAVSAGEHILEKVVEVSFTPPDTLAEVYDTPLVFPIRVEEHPYFESEFSRMTLALLAEGKSAEDIHALTGADRQFVLEQLRFFAGQRFIQQKNNAVDLAVPVLTKEEASVQAQLADRIAASLAETIAGNMPAYRKALDSLVAARVVPTDSADLLDDAVVLYKPYPVVGALLLWHAMGTQFIAGGNELDMFWGLDICNLPKLEYLYASPAGSEFNGRFFYAHLNDSRNTRIVFADHSPRIICSGNFPPKRGATGSARWRHDESDRPEYIMLNLKKVSPAVAALTTGTGDVLNQALQELRSNSEQFGRPALTRGYKHWFWNLATTKTMDLLIEQGVLTDPGNALYVFSVKEGN